MTKTIMMKMSDDALYSLLDELYDEGKENSEKYRLIDEELDLRAERLEAIKEVKKQKQLEVELHRQGLIEQLKEIEKLNGERITMTAMAIEFGGDYRDDYVIGDEFTVISLCKQVNMKNMTKWEHESLSEAKAKIEQLVYWRVYDNLFRNGSTDELMNRLVKRIIKIKAAK